MLAERRRSFNSGSCNPLRTRQRAYNSKFKTILVIGGKEEVTSEGTLGGSKNTW